MRTYMVVIDDNEAARAALRFAARRATRTGGSVEILALVPQQEFVQWGAVQATFEEEARLRAEAMVAQAASALIEETGVMPSITVRKTIWAAAGIALVAVLLIAALPLIASTQLVRDRIAQEMGLWSGYRVILGDAP